MLAKKIRIQKLAEQLRSQGMLNEEAWLCYRTHIKRIHIGMALMTVLVAVILYLKEGFFSSSVVVVALVFLWLGFFKSSRRDYLIYTLGKKTQATVTWVLSDSRYDIGIR